MPGVRSPRTQTQTLLKSFSAHQPEFQLFSHFRRSFSVDCDGTTAFLWRCLLQIFRSKLSLLYLYGFSFAVSPPCFHTADLPLYSLPRSALLPFTPVASDSLRQPLPAWVKSSGPAGRAKPGACFPSERFLFARSGN